MPTTPFSRLQLSRREFVRFGATSLALGIAAACAPASGGSTASTDNAPKSLNVGQWGTAQRAELYKSALALF
ncbi:MAG TPA: hypothetical protein VGQ62_22605, partial [Chloroflexota bacterium]|nr:hypothetical protein [Chloroflexota bacterium]